MSIQEPGAPGSMPTPQDGLPGATAESVSSTVAGYAIERTIQGNQALESLESGQKDVRVGGTGPSVGVNGVGLENIDISISKDMTMLNNDRKDLVYIPNVGNRFSR